MTEANRRCLSALVSAGTKLDAASRLAKEATIIQRIAAAIETIP